MEQLKEQIKRSIGSVPVIEKSNCLAEIQVSYRTKVKPSDMPRITTSKDAYEQFKKVWSQDMEWREEFMMLCLNRANKVLGWIRISQGGVSGTVVDPKLIFQVALNANASAIMLAHNHPSANLKPSDADIRLTKQVKQAGLVLEIAVLDHIILTAEGYYSFADEGML